MADKRVCIIGAGPSGCSALIHFKKMKEKFGEGPEVVCYEKQEDWGGLWNYTWRTGLDQYGQSVHCSTYRHLWANAPKECLELGDYTFDEHFGKPTPSYPPRPALVSYLHGRWNKNNIRGYIQFNQAVHHVTYDDASRKFTVTVKHLPTDRSRDEVFDYVIVCTGHFSTPHVPDFPGMDQFPGRVIHAHDLRDANQFKGDRVLVVGGSYSAEDIAQQTLKFGARHVTVSYRTKPSGYKWPEQIDERPLITRIEGSTVSFKDGSSDEYDSIILCTGYLHDLWFMAEPLRLRAKNELYLNNLYKAVVWTPSANGQLHYIGYTNQFYSMPMFDVEAYFSVKLILGLLQLPCKEEMEKDWKEWRKRLSILTELDEMIDFQTDYVEDLKKISGYPYKIDVAAMLKRWSQDRLDDITTFRDKKCFTSIHTGTESIRHHTPWYQCMSEDLDEFLKS